MEEDISNTQGDISNKTIVVLVILTVIISVLGTLTVLVEVSGMQASNFKEIHRGGNSLSRVSLRVVPAEPAAEPSKASGYVALEILPTEQ
jgi:hypothetical protein